MNKIADVESGGSRYSSLCKIGGIAAFIALMLIICEIIWLILFPQPTTVIDWFALFQNNKLTGLLDFWGLEIPGYVMFAIMFTALYAAIRKADEGVMTIALIFALLGIGIFLATNNPFSMLSASDKYASATTDIQRSTLIAAGETILANTNQRAVGGFNIGLFLLSVSGLMIAVTMLRSSSFGRLTAIMGIVSNALSLADFLRQAITSSAIVALLVILPGAITLMIWYGLIGRRLWQMGSGVVETEKRK